MKRTHITITSMLALLIISTLFFTGTAQSQPATAPGDDNPPQIIQSPTNTLFSYQGQLLDAGGAPINNAAMPMTFKLYSALTGGAACWSETQTITVQNGQFNALIGEVSAIPDTCLTGDIYLELVVNGETMTPRELLTSAAHAVEASTLPDQATTRGSLNIAPSTDGEGGQINLLQGSSGNNWVIDNRFGTFRLHHSGQVYFSIASNGAANIAGDLNLNGKLSTTGINVPFSIATERPWQFEQRNSGSSTVTVLRSTSDNKNFRFLNPDDSPILSIHAANNGGSVTVHKSLIVLGNCSVAQSGGVVPTGFDESCANGEIITNNLTTGAVVEANLQTPEEKAAETIERFSLGDVLCWSPESEQLELCATSDDRLVMAVANSSGKPVVMGAEPVKVLGPVQAGDILVASDTPGYAIVNNNPAPGTVIGQALEDFNGESGIIKAMIRKW